MGFQEKSVENQGKQLEFNPSNPQNKINFNVQNAHCVRIIWYSPQTKQQSSLFFHSRCTINERIYTHFPQPSSPLFYFRILYCACFLAKHHVDGTYFGGESCVL